MPRNPTLAPKAILPSDAIITAVTTCLLNFLFNQTLVKEVIEISHLILCFANPLSLKEKS